MRNSTPDRLDRRGRITLVVLLSAAGIGCSGQQTVAPPDRGAQTATRSIATDAPSLRRAVRNRESLRGDVLPWYAARRDQTPSVIVGTLGPTIEQSVTTTHDHQVHTSTRVHDHVHSRTIHARSTLATQ